jgi:hypothetical protein
MRLVQGDVPHFVLVRRGDEQSGLLGGFAALILPRCALSLFLEYLPTQQKLNQHN